MKKHALAVAVATFATGLLAQVGTAAAESSSLDRARAGTARYRNFEAAGREGYGLLTDAAGIACIDNPGVGGMGIHYAKGALVADPALNAAKPEVLVYAPESNGRLRLVALEYVVLQSAWEQAGHAAPPTLFDQQFELVPAGNRYGLPPFYELHAWIWKENPRGMFDDWNPRVSCP
ncbi:MAG: hypothetical protein ABI912_08780 [Actinomycetota bacterium]